MGVYIKNMKMPKGFEMLVVFSDGTAHKCLPGMREHVEKGTAVPVPPHGRLIDADALVIPKTHVDMFENCRNCMLLDAEQVKEIISNAPTIIPATK